MAAAPAAVKKAAAPAKPVNPLYEKRPKTFGALQAEELLSNSQLLGQCIVWITKARKALKKCVSSCKLWRMAATVLPQSQPQP